MGTWTWTHPNSASVSMGRGTCPTPFRRVYDLDDVWISARRRRDAMLAGLRVVPLGYARLRRACCRSRLCGGCCRALERWRGRGMRVTWPRDRTLVSQSIRTSRRMDHTPPPCRPFRCESMVEALGEICERMLEGRSCCSASDQRNHQIGYQRA